MQLYRLSGFQNQSFFLQKGPNATRDRQGDALQDVTVVGHFTGGGEVARSWKVRSTSMPPPPGPG